MNVLIVFGTRPEAIKMAPVIKQFQQVSSISLEVCVTAQHRQMLDQVLDLFDIKPDYDLDIMKSGQNLTDITSNILLGMQNVLQQKKYDLLLVHGDTTTTMATALAAFYEQIPVAHVEAGLRTGNMYAPWPEEMNRSLVGRIASVHFAPTQRAKQSLLSEGIKEKNIIVTGNTVIDTLQEVVSKIEKNSILLNALKEQFDFLDRQKRLILVTGHRRENFGGGFENICHALKQLSKHDNVEIVYPVHLNPAVQKPVKQILKDINNIHLIAPLDYLPFVYLMNRAYLMITDSGGIQEEAPSLGKPVLVMRETTERPEAVEAGTVKLVGTNIDQITNEAKKLLNDPALYQKMSQALNPYGDGHASKRILAAIQAL